jgi:hypothetical protein
MLNVKFQFGLETNELVFVNVANVTSDYMTFERSVSEEGIVGYQPAYDVAKIMKLWKEQERPSYLNIADLKKNRWGNDGVPNTEEVF